MIQQFKVVQQLKVILQFYIVIFIVSFLADVVLNDLSKSGFSKIISSLKPYFANKSIVESGIYAGLTIVSATIPTMIVFKTFTKKWIPTTLPQLFEFLLIAFPIGYIFDIVIDRYKVFGNDLDSYYKIAGAGLWGALSFEFAIFVTYVIINVIFGC